MTPNIDVRIVRKPGRKFLYMRYTDPYTGRDVTRSTRETTTREAERVAARWEAELKLKGVPRRGADLTLDDFLVRLFAEKMASLSDGYAASMRSALNAFLSSASDQLPLSKVTAETISRFQVDVRKSGVEESTLRSYLRHLKAALSWAVDVELMDAMPKIMMPKRARSKAKMKGRPLSDDELCLLLAACPAVRPLDFPVWERYLMGLWLSGLRLGESLRLSWDEWAAFSVDASGAKPRFRIHAEAQKSRKDELLPMTPDFAMWLMRTPVDLRHGPVFPEVAAFNPVVVIRIVGKIGRRAGVKTGEKSYATAHDLRRSFGTRWAMRVRQPVLQRLMRHSDIKTTTDYYIGIDTDEMSLDLWSKFGE